MKINTRDNVAKFFYDSGKVTFAILVVGVFARKPFASSDATWGAIFTLILVLLGVIIDQWYIKKEA